MDDPIPTDGTPVRLPALVGRCPDCGGPLDVAIDGGDSDGFTINLSCWYDCDGPGLQSDWQPIKDRARKWANERTTK